MFLRSRYVRKVDDLFLEERIGPDDCRNELECALSLGMVTKALVEHGGDAGRYSAICQSWR